MSRLTPKVRWELALLGLDPPDPTHYREYRMSLEAALDRARRFDRIAFHLCWSSFLTALALMFVGGTQVLGPFDPFDRDASSLSVSLGVLWVVASVAWPLALAASLAHFLPRIRRLNRELTDARIERLENEVAELRRRTGE